MTVDVNSHFELFQVMNFSSLVLCHVPRHNVTFSQILNSLNFLNSQTDWIS